MVYNTGNGASLQKLPDKSQILGKRQWILLLKIEKKKSKTRNNFQKLLEQISQSPQYNQSAGWVRTEQRKQNVYEETSYQELASQTYLKILVPYLNNSSEETIFGSNEIKEQREAMKLQYEIHLKPQGNELEAVSA